MLKVTEVPARNARFGPLLVAMVPITTMITKGLQM